MRVYNMHTDAGKAILKFKFKTKAKRAIIRNRPIGNSLYCMGPKN